MSETKCVFCEIVAGNVPARVIMENELSMIILDINPFSKGHCLALPKRHVPWWHEMTEEETASLFTLARLGEAGSMDEAMEMLKGAL